MLEKINKPTAGERIVKNIKRVLANKASLEATTHDYFQTFKALGLKVNDAQSIAHTILTTMHMHSAIEDVEKVVKHLFAGFKGMEGIPLLTAIDKHRVQRSSLLYEQIKPDLYRRGNVLHYGCGNGQVALLMHQDTMLSVSGADIKNFMIPEAANTVKYVPIKDYSLPCKNEAYGVTLLLNVANHADSPEVLIAEAARVTSTKIIMMETFANGDEPADLENDWGRVFMNDVLWNRFFSSGDIPVRGNYRTTHEWRVLLHEHGFDLRSFKDYGRDQPMINVRHQKMVFTR